MTTWYRAEFTTRPGGEDDHDNQTYQAAEGHDPPLIAAWLRALADRLDPPKPRTGTQPATGLRADIAHQERHRDRGTWGRVGFGHPHATTEQEPTP